jgi:glycosyltransferase involved in cell wall biosynthesis
MSSKIAVVYPRIGRGMGGIESVTKEVLSEFSEKDDVVFFSVVPGKFRNGLSDDVLERIEVQGLDSGFPVFLRDSERLQLLKEKLVHRSIGKSLEDESSDFDAMFFTSKFMYSGDFDCPTLHFVHNPSLEFKREEYSSTPLKKFYDTFLEFISADVFDADLNMFNSKFTRDTYSSIDGRVVYPPVKSDFRPGEKKDKVICLGRIVQGKRIEEAIRIVDETETDLEMSVVGRLTQSSRKYYDKLKRKEEKHEWLEIKTDLPQDELVEEMAESKIGILSTRNEHFGIAAVEYMKSGALPMVRAGGGVQDLVKKENFTYSDIEEASEKIKRNLEVYEDLKEFVLDRGSEFDVESFRRCVREGLEEVS